jgi:hypothetical protein
VISAATTTIIEIAMITAAGVQEPISRRAVMSADGTMSA